MRFAWSFRREAVWLAWLTVAIPVIVFVLVIVLPGLFRRLGW